jgi:hypothetical protein
MPRTKTVIDVHGKIANRVLPFTPKEETAKDVEEATWEAGAADRAVEEVQKNRRDAYHAESDELFFQEQRGEISEGTWTAKVDEIKLRFPK